MTKTIISPKQNETQTHANDKIVAAAALAVTSTVATAASLFCCYGDLH